MTSRVATDTMMQHPAIRTPFRATALATGLAVLVATPPAAAQESPAGAADARGEWTVAPFVGYAQHSPGGTRWGKTPDRNHFFVGVHLTAPVLRLGALSLSYAPNVVPLLVLTNNPRYEVRPVAEGEPPEAVEVGRGWVYGTGFAPLGLQLGLRVSPHAELYGGGAVGALWFRDVVPIRDGRHFNFTYEFGGGLVVRTSSRVGLQAGYKFHHLSNLYTAPANPGVDAHVFYGGVQWTTRLPQ